MIEYWLRISAVAIAFCLVFATGFKLTRRGRPYSVALLAEHKLVAVGVLVFLTTNIYAAWKMSDLAGTTWLVILLALLLFIAAIASGGVLSAAGSRSRFVLILHKISPYATVFFTAVAYGCLR